MSNQKTAYELARSQVSTPLDIVKLFWRITHVYRDRLPHVLDLGAGDCRFALAGRYDSYLGIEIDDRRHPLDDLPDNARVQYRCAFEDDDTRYDACIGNPPYVRHHDLNRSWRDAIARRLEAETGESINRKCNLYVYFMFLAILKTRDSGIVSLLIPYDWASRPSAAPLRRFIEKNNWNVDIYRFSAPIFDGVLTTVSISVVDKGTSDGRWNYHRIGRNGDVSRLKSVTGSEQHLLPYEARGKIWAQRGMSPGSQRVFTLSEGERIHAGLTKQDVWPCVTSLRGVPATLSLLTEAAFRKRFVDAGSKCWLIKSSEPKLSPRLLAYLSSVSEEVRATATCNARDLWYRYPLLPIPQLIVSTGFKTFGPKVLVNTFGVRPVGAVAGIYADFPVGATRLRQYLTSVNLEGRVVPHAKEFRKLEIRQLNAVLNQFQNGDSPHD